MSIGCSTGGMTSVNLQAAGKFEPEPGTTDVVGRTHFSGTDGRTGELTFRR